MLRHTPVAGVLAALLIGSALSGCGGGQVEPISRTVSSGAQAAPDATQAAAAEQAVSDATAAAAPSSKDALDVRRLLEAYRLGFPSRPQTQWWPKSG